MKLIELSRSRLGSARLMQLMFAGGHYRREQNQSGARRLANRRGKSPHFRMRKLCAPFRAAFVGWLIDLPMRALFCLIYCSRATRRGFLRGSSAKRRKIPPRVASCLDRYCLEQQQQQEQKPKQLCWKTPPSSCGQPSIGPPAWRAPGTGNGPRALLMVPAPL